MRAMILAAGKGVRMRPLTDDCPKPLLEVGGRTLIDRHLDALARAGFSDVVINLHYLGDMIRSQVGDGTEYGLNIAFTEESEPLETAGGIRKALALLGDEPFVVVAGDIFTDYDYRRLPRDLGRSLGHLVMVDNPEHHRDGDFVLETNGRLQLANGGEALTFSGIAVYSPALFVGLEDNVPAKLRMLFDAAIPRGLMTGEHFHGEWSDVGTPERLTELDDKLRS